MKSLQATAELPYRLTRTGEQHMCCCLLQLPRPCELIHLEIKKHGRIGSVGHRITILLLPAKVLEMADQVLR